MSTLFAIIPLMMAQSPSGIELPPRRLVSKQPLSSFHVPADFKPSDFQVVVKFNDELKVRCDTRGSVRATGSGSLEGFNSLTSELFVTFRPWLSASPKDLDELGSRAAARSGIASADLAGFMVAQLASDSTESRITLAQTLHSHGSVEFVELVPTRFWRTSSSAPAPTSKAAPAAPPAPTPDLSINQDWRTASLGLDFDSANARGALGAGVRHTCIDGAWLLPHEDTLDSNGVDLISREPNVTFAVLNVFLSNHGTASIGIPAAQHNGIGMDGGAPDAEFFVHPTHIQDATGATVTRPNDAIASAFIASGPGDVVALEIETWGPGNNQAFWEAIQSQWILINQGALAGIVVVEPTGNGGENFDIAAYDTYRTWGDSGAIIIGASDATVDRNRHSASGYGARVDLHAWGANVATLGLGDLFQGVMTLGGPNRSYTDAFGITSSSCPIVATGALAVQSYAIAQGRAPLDGREMRFLLKETGVLPTLPSQLIGEQPNLDAALDELDCGFHRNYCVAGINATGTSGLIKSSGSSSIANNDLVLTATRCNPNKLGIFIYGPGRAYAPFGNGHLCIQSHWNFAIVNTLADGSASAAFPQAPPGSPFALSAGSLFNFQFYYRDGATVNATDAIEIVFCP